YEGDPGSVGRIVGLLFDARRCDRPDGECVGLSQVRSPKIRVPKHVDIGEPASLVRDGWHHGICTRCQNGLWFSWPRKRDTNQPRASATLLDTDQLRSVGGPDTTSAILRSFTNRERNGLAGGLGEGNHSPI